MVELLLNKSIYCPKLNSFIRPHELALSEHINVRVDFEGEVGILSFVRCSLSFVLSLLGSAPFLLFGLDFLTVRAVRTSISFFHLERLLDCLCLRLAFFLRLPLVAVNVLGFLAQDRLLVSAQAVENAHRPLTVLEKSSFLVHERSDVNLSHSPVGRQLLLQRIKLFDFKAFKPLSPPGEVDVIESHLLKRDLSFLLSVA